MCTRLTWPCDGTWACRARARVARSRGAPRPHLLSRGVLARESARSAPRLTMARTAITGRSRGIAASLAGWRRGESNPGRRESEMSHGPRKRTVVSFDYPEKARQVPPFGPRVPKSSGAMLPDDSSAPRCCRPGRRLLATPDWSSARRAQCEKIRNRAPPCQFAYLYPSRVSGDAR
jgi:hypothetical protein